MSIQQIGVQKVKLKFGDYAKGILFSTQTDSGRAFEITILDESESPIDITNLTLDFYVSANKEVSKVTASIKDAQKGIFLVEAAATQFSYSGIHKAQFVLRDSEGIKLSSRVFEIYIEESIENGATIGRNVIVDFEVINKALELLENQAETLEEAKNVDANLKADIETAVATKTTLNETVNTANTTDTNLKKTIETAKTTDTALKATNKSANDTNTAIKANVSLLVSENDEAVINIENLKKSNDTALATDTALKKTTDTANSTNTTLNGTIDKATTAEGSLEEAINQAGVGGFATKTDLNRDPVAYSASTLRTPQQYLDTMPSSGTLEYLSASVLGSMPIKACINGSFALVNTIVPFTNLNSLPIQIAFGKQSIAIRQAVNGDNWGNWNLMALTTDIKTKLSELVQDASFRTVTDAEKTTWNGKQDKIVAGTNITINADGKTINAINTVTSINGKTGVITKEDIGALGIPTQNVSYSIATQTESGLMSAADKTKLDSVETGAQKNTVTSVQGRTGAVMLTKADITALGIPAQDTTYNVATTTTNGLISAADKVKLNGLGAQTITTGSAESEWAAAPYSSFEFIKIGNVARVYGGFTTIINGNTAGRTKLFTFPAGFLPKYSGGIFTAFLFSIEHSEQTLIPCEVYNGYAQIISGYGAYDTDGKTFALDYVYLCQ